MSGGGDWASFGGNQQGQGKVNNYIKIHPLIKLYFFLLTNEGWRLGKLWWI